MYRIPESPPTLSITSALGVFSWAAQDGLKEEMFKWKLDLP